MDDPLRRLLTRWELQPPRFDAYDFRRPQAEFLYQLIDAGVLVPSTPLGTWDCADCGSVCRLIYVDQPGGGQRTFAACPRCGPMEVRSENLRRYEIDSQRLLESIFEGYRLAVESLNRLGLWRVGRHKIGERSREVYFSRGSDGGLISTVCDVLGSHGKSCVFTPTRVSALKLSENLSCVVVGLEDVLDWTGNGFQLDDDAINGRFDSLESAPKPAKPKPKRSTRAAAIEALRRELNAHIVAAADHAFDTQARTGTPVLLPRPTQAELAARINVSAPTLSRCMEDRSAPELRILWDAADDVYEVMKWRKLAVKNRG